VCNDCTVKLYADDAKIYKCIKCPMDRIVLQSALDSLYVWANLWDLHISIDKCNFMQIGYRNLALVYSVGSQIIVPCKSVIDLGVTIDSNLKPSSHCVKIVYKASARAKLILRAFLSCDYKILTRAFITYVRPLLEYCSPAWSPNNKGDVELVENVQRLFTRKLYFVCNMPYVTYDERLLFLGLERLELRRLHADVVFMYNIVKGFVCCNLLHKLTFTNYRPTRGHRYKLFVNRCNKLVFSCFFINRVLPIWNHLPDNCFDCNTVSAFKSRLSNVNLSSYLKGKT
jgi:ribonucleases P/MRP protein subunit RPP40